ncbi:hypothetical protein ACOMHN_015645 [Nucella lapillus]
MLLRTHGEMLTARRKNRLERFRLDQQLKELEKDGARQKFQVERQKRSVFLAWQSIPLTTCYSDKAQAPDSLQDNAYHKSKHSQRRLPEKRLMQWKAREKELEKFLWRFESQHGKNTSTKQYLPRSASDSPETELNSQRHDDSKSSEKQTSGPSSQKDTLTSNISEGKKPTKWRRDLMVDKSLGFRSSGGVGHSAALSKTARQRALTNMVDENRSELGTVIRGEKLRKLQCRGG